MAIFKKRFLCIPFLSLSLALSACTFGDGGKWKEEFGTPELVLEHAMEECYVFLYEKQDEYCKDEGNLIKEAIAKAAPFTESEYRAQSSDIRYFTYQASWVAATSGPNYVHLAIWQNGFVRIDHKTSLGPHEYLYFSITPDKAISLVDYVFSTIESKAA